jgi:hypothetical protein
MVAPWAVHTALLGPSPGRCSSVIPYSARTPSDAIAVTYETPIVARAADGCQGPGRATGNLAGARRRQGCLGEAERLCCLYRDSRE